MPRSASKWTRPSISPSRKKNRRLLPCSAMSSIPGSRSPSRSAAASTACWRGSRTMAELTYRDALRKALADAMTENPDVIILGEEVGRYGGAYGVTKDLIKEFGPERVIDTPISEAAIVGAVVGAA